jgi:hypothetical protein
VAGSVITVVQRLVAVRQSADEQVRSEKNIPEAGE